MVAQRLYGGRLQCIRQPGLGQRLCKTNQRSSGSSGLHGCGSPDRPNALLRRNVGRFEQQRKRLLKRGGRARPLNPRSTATLTIKARPTAQAAPLSFQSSCNWQQPRYQRLQNSALSRWGKPVAPAIARPAFGHNRGE